MHEMVFLKEIDTFAIAMPVLSYFVLNIRMINSEFTFIHLGIPDPN